MYNDKGNTKYLKLLKQNYSSSQDVIREIVNLSAIINLPKGTEFFLSDIHGEYEAFLHIMNNCSGVIKEKVDLIFKDTISDYDRQELCTLIYYPREKMALLDEQGKIDSDWYAMTLNQLILVAKLLSSKYTRSKVRKALPEEYAYIIDELLHAQEDEDANQVRYHKQILKTIIDLEDADEFIIALSALIKRLAVDHLHVLGDIYDRGAGPHLIMDRLCRYHSLDIQWGNHDIIWMGAAAGNPACIATVVRNSIRYGNLDVVEEGYGINMLPLATFALKAYKDDPCTRFVFKVAPSGADNMESDLIKKMHKAIAIIRFKLEGQLIKKWPEYGMKERLLLEHIDYEQGTIELEGRTYKLLDTSFPTIDPADPYRLTEGEEEVIQRLRSSFIHCEKLKNHVGLLLKKGSMYKVYNGNLLFHGCIPMEEDGSFAKVNIYGKEYSGKALFDILETYVRKAFFSDDRLERQKGSDIMWYIWTAPYSPLYGRNKMATFERYFIDDDDMQIEKKNFYYDYINKPECAQRILEEFGLHDKRDHIINGHVPVHRLRGESPVKCDGRVIVIDGGFSKAYRRRTGIAGYTLIYNSYGLTLTAHEPFESPETAVRDERDIVSRREAVEVLDKRILVGDTDAGIKMKEKIADLKHLIAAYRSGEIAERDD